jgi:hypothetical protein
MRRNSRPFHNVQQKSGHDDPTKPWIDRCYNSHEFTPCSCMAAVLFSPSSMIRAAHLLSGADSARVMARALLQTRMTAVVAALDAQMPVHRAAPYRIFRRTKKGG